MKRCWMILMVCVVVLAGTALGDVATPRPQWTKVQMESETVDIAVGDARVAVTATFKMRNHGGTGNVVMGYPVGEFEAGLNAFAVSVDGKAIAAVRDESKPGASGPSRRSYGGKGGRKPGMPGGAETYRFQGPYRAWKVWNVAMTAGKVHTVKLTYWVKPAALADAKKRTLRHYTYTLLTGATWKGKIKEAVIRVRLQGVEADQLVRVAPNNYQATKGNRTMTWTLRDFKPTHNIDITWRPERPETGDTAMQKATGGR